MQKSQEVCKEELYSDVDFTTMEDVWTWITYAEEQINPDKQLYLITFSPDPEYLPNVSFIDQHLFLWPWIDLFLKYCSAGAMCVESNQRGNPHYHGWYQQSEIPGFESGRICASKVFNQFAPQGFKITKATHYRIGNWSDTRSNCLHYYKKDVLTNMIRTPHPVIIHRREYEEEFFKMPPEAGDGYIMFWGTPKKRMSVADRYEKATIWKRTHEFYSTPIAYS